MRKGKEIWSREEGKDEKILAQVMAENPAEGPGAAGLRKEKEAYSGSSCVDTEIYRTKEGTEADGLRSSGAKSGLKDGEKDEVDYEELVNQRIAKAVLSRPVLHMDYQEFDAWLKDGQRKYMAKRRRKQRRLCSIAVCICLCIGAVTMIPPLVGESSAARDDDMTIVEENGNIIIGGNGEAGVGFSVAEYESLNDMSPREKEDLVLFDNIPKGYVLSSIRIEELQGRKESTLKYVNENSEKMIIKENEKRDGDNQVTIFMDFEECFNNKGITVYKREDVENNFFAFIAGNVIVDITVRPNVLDEEIEAMIDSLYQVKMD